MIILGIETSCDETATAIVENGTKILSNVIVSQIDIHAAYGGVVPEIAARSHIEAILPVIHQALDEAHLTWGDIDAIAVTHTPGLLGSLLIGTLTARTLSILHNKPLYPTHHLKSHIYANWLDKSHVGEIPEGGFQEALPSVTTEATRTWRPPVTTGRPQLRSLESLLPEFPLIALVISGGHTQLIHMKTHNNFKIIGTTRDDAIGEVFDKTAKILGLPYPGGPSIAKAAQKGNPNAYKLPIPKVPAYDFSFSGLKTAVLRAVQTELNLPITTPSHTLAAQLTNKQINDFAASFQKTAITALIQKTQKAIEEYHPKSLLLAGGVSANQSLREALAGKIGEGRFSDHSVSPVKNTTTTSDSLGRVSKWDPPKGNKTGRGIFDKREQTDDPGNAPRLFFPQPSLSTDNAAMVASAAYFSIKEGQTPTNPYNLDISPRSQIN